ncbi:hypothetical protein PQU92_16140 [Asticcacaulis sp. BYS171W]|uniref:Uncharacterized protein n=1 Tax=Asticcacaulis aquaticus TaxID=2984212 RepID=A0ABT5HYA8_9CAUL|nr:hypothetical protein [Asticcacaulis aquaticus]MDC7684815.1 hypothetical protein [Asticcacaulis aquaticus]
MTTREAFTQKSDHALGVLREAVAEAIDRKRRLGQYWVVWDGEKPVEVHPDTETRPAAE